MIHQKPLVKVGDRISAGDIIADGASMNYGELALGKKCLDRICALAWI